MTVSKVVSCHSTILWNAHLHRKMANGEGMISKVPSLPSRPIPKIVTAHWKRFKRAWENYDLVSYLCLHALAKATRVATFLRCFGADALDMLDDEERKDDSFARHRTLQSATRIKLASDTPKNR